MEKFGCFRCGHEWIARKEQPIVCPRCHSAYWNIPKNERKGNENAKNTNTE